MENFSNIIDTIQKGGQITGALELSMLERMIDLDSKDSPFADHESFFLFLNENVAALKGVKKLSLRTNQLKHIPDFVFSLTGLQDLELNRNDISEIPPQIENLEELRVLDLSNNNVLELPDEILELRSLEVLRVHRNDLIKLPQKIHKLTNLKELIALDNSIEAIPKSIVRLKLLDEVRLQDNPIKNVPSAIYTQGNGIDALRHHFKTSDEELSTYYGVKIIVVGDGEVGKTTIVKNLEDICAMEDHPSTIGLEVKDWTFTSKTLDQALKFKIWDFGGQGKYRTVQQLFCTPNAIYIYVTVPQAYKKPEKYGSFQYWLNFINVVSDKSPVIFISNKMDKLDNDDDFFLDEASIKKSFPSIQKFIKTRFDRRKFSTQARASIKSAIEDCIQDEPLNANFHFEKLPNDWITVIDKLNELRSSKHFITKNIFYAICRDIGIYDTENQQYLLKYLDKSGAILLYDNEKSIASEFQIILNPNWIKEAVYKVVNYLEQKNKPWFVINEIKNIWNDFDERGKYYLELIELIGDLNFSFVINNRHYIPSLLPSFQIDKEEEENTFIYTYIYEFKPYIPAGLLHKLITYNIDYIESEKHLWENKVIFNWGEQKIKVEALEYWDESKLVFNINSKSLAVAKSFSKEIEKAIKEFEGRNYVNELDKEEIIIYNKNTTKLEDLQNIEYIDEIYRHINIEQKFIQLNVNNQIGGDITIHAPNQITTNLIPFKISDYPDFIFQNDPYSNQLKFDEIWDNGNRSFFSTQRSRGKAVFLKNEKWYQLFYRQNDIEAAFDIIRELPSESEAVKFVALPKPLWTEVARKWKDLHFHNHYVYQFPKQPSNFNVNFEPLLISDLAYIAKNQKYLDEYGGVDYLKHRIQQKLTAGYRHDNKLIAWSVLHDDGVMGFLRVLDQHRGNKIGTQLSAYLINLVIDSGKHAIAHISHHNKVSQKIAEKLKGKIVDEVAWVRLRTQQEKDGYKQGKF